MDPESTVKRDCGGSAAENLLPLVYDELRRLAAARLAQENPGQTLQATALVNEAYLRLVNLKGPQEWKSRGHFFAAAAEAMRRILVDNARRKRRQKRGAGAVREQLSDVPLPGIEPHEDLIALDAALDRLRQVDPRAVELVHLRYFAGCSITEAACHLGVSTRTADRLWAFARAWLGREVSRLRTDC